MGQDAVINFSEWGLPGVIIGTLFAFVYFLIKTHKEERTEWISAYKEASRMADTRQAETNGVLLELVSSYKILADRSARRATDNII